MIPEAGGFAADAAAPDLYVSPAARVVRCVIWGEPIYFTVANPKDSIQRHHLQGSFYEPEELEIIRRYLPPGAVFLDIGANVGNHAVFALKFLRAAKVIPVEPNPLAIELLMSNLSLNGLMDRVDASHLGIGLSDEEAAGLSVDVPRRNLGGTRMVEGGGDLRVMTGDDALGDQHVDFIKIDVEGMEVRVLRGLERKIAQCHPPIFIEVDNRNRKEFFAWMNEAQYGVVENFRRYRRNENFLIASVAQPAAPEPATA